MNININPIGSKKELVERIKDLGSKINEGINSTNSINDSLFDVIQSGIKTQSQKCLHLRYCYDSAGSSVVVLVEW